MNLTIKHIAGLKNELSDWLSRGQFESLVKEDFDSIAAEAFARMDQQLDFGILFKLSDILRFSKEDYLGSEYKDIWNSLEERKSTLLEEKMFYRTEIELFVETKKVVPKAKLERILRWCHEVNGHPGAEKTVLFFAQNFFADLPKKDLIQIVREFSGRCEICLKTKSNDAKDRGIVSSLPIPQLANDTLFIDFISMDPCNEYNYVLTIVDSLTKFCKFIPCSKSITGEETLKLILKEWVMHYDKPHTIMSDNDVRFAQ